MAKELIDLNVNTIQDKQYLTDILNFWLHMFMLRIAKHNLDTDDIYKLAINLANFRDRISHNKNKVEITSSLQSVLFLNVIDTFIECTISHQTGQINGHYIHSLNEIASILKFEESLIVINNNISKKYPLNKKETSLFVKLTDIMRTIIKIDKPYFDSKCFGHIAVHFD